MEMKREECIEEEEGNNHCRVRRREKEKTKEDQKEKRKKIITKKDFDLRSLFEPTGRCNFFPIFLNSYEEVWCSLGASDHIGLTYPSR